MGASGPGVGYNLLVCHLLRPLVKRSIRVGVTQFSRCCVSQFPLARKRNSLPPCASQVRRCLALLQLLLVRLHPRTSANCPTCPSEMSPVPQLKMQKSPVFCVARAGSWRLELFLFGHLALPPVLLLMSIYIYYVLSFQPEGLSLAFCVGLVYC